MLEGFGRETVAAAELGPDKVAVFAKGFAHRGDLNFQVLIRHSDARPDAVHELVFSNQRSVGLQQDQEEIEGARPNSIGTPSASNCRCRSSRRKRPNSSVASVAARRDRFPVINELSQGIAFTASMRSLP